MTKPNPEHEPLRVLFVTSEVAPFSKTGGLADISAALPAALAAEGCDVRVLSPLYGFIDKQRFGIDSRPIAAAFSRTGPESPQPQFYFLECDPLFDRPGVYVDPFTNRDYIDNDYRFIALCRAAMEFIRAARWTPHIVHCNDWQTGLVPLYLHESRARKSLRSVRSLFTIHNIAYQGMFGADAAMRAGEAHKYFYPAGPVEFYGYMSFLKAGLEFADSLNTVSPTYAREIETSGEISHGLDAVLRARGEIGGILNGIDTRLWNPAADDFLPATFDSGSLDAKETDKQALCARIGLPYDRSIPVIGIISRLAAQKGFELIAPVLGEILALPAQLVLLGSGDPYLERLFTEAARSYPDRLAVRIGYDDEFSHLIEAGADLFLMPSRFEPCGLNQMMSMRYGTLPVVRATGGLADTVADADSNPVTGTGFSFDDYTPEAMMEAVRRAVGAFTERPRWRKIQKNAMAQDFSWNRSAKRYVDLYRRTLSSNPRVIA